MAKEPFLTDITQVAVVVPNLEEAMRVYEEDYGIGPFEILEFSNETGGHSMSRNDEPQDYAMRIAFCDIGRLNWELIEPLDDHSHYAEFLKEKGMGIHHVSVKTSKSFDEAVQELRDKGHTSYMGGGYEQNKFHYMTTDRDLGAIIEVVHDPNDL
jgi:methylmalonyl-CoA/ethylmalonyl-CoA epimerase